MERSNGISLIPIGIIAFAVLVMLLGVAQLVETNKELKTMAQFQVKAECRRCGEVIEAGDTVRIIKMATLSGEDVRYCAVREGSLRVIFKPSPGYAVCEECWQRVMEIWNEVMDSKARKDRIGQLLRESNEAMRGGKVAAAVRLYNEAWEMKQGRRTS